MKLSSKSALFLILFILSCTFSFVHALEASSQSVEFIIDSSEGMNESMGNKSKIDTAREVVGKVLSEIPESIGAGVIFYGNTKEDKCEEIEQAVHLKGLDRGKMKEELMKGKTMEKSPVTLALKKAVEELNDNKNFLSVVLVTDGKGPCKDGLLKTALEIRERYDFRVTFHVVAIGNDVNAGNLLNAAYIGYGQYIHLKNNRNVEAAVKLLAENINKPFIHQPKEDLEEMVMVPAGEFSMGSDEIEEAPSHPVYLDAFYIDKYEVTQRPYKAAMGVNPSTWIGSDLPVQKVSWLDAKTYCEKKGKRLPTEAEWEKAAKGGKDDIWAGTSILEELGEYAWLDETIRGFTTGEKLHPVGQKKPNGYGIYDMSGNIEEWVADWYSGEYYKNSPKANPKGPEKGVLRVVRGGDWDNHQVEVRTAQRKAKFPDTKLTNYGFRCAKSAE